MTGLLTKYSFQFGRTLNFTKTYCLLRLLKYWKIRKLLKTLRSIESLAFVIHYLLTQNGYLFHLIVVKC